MELFQILSNISASLDASGKGMSMNLIVDSFSTCILMICLGLEIAWLLVQAALDDDGGESVAMGVRALAIAMIAWSLFLNWQAVADDINKTSTAVVQKVGGNQDMGGIIANTLDKALQSTKIDQVYASQSSTEGDKQGGQNWFSALTGSLAFGQIFDKALAGILGLFNGGIVGIVVGVALFILLAGKFALWIGVLFGPLCLAFSPLRLTRRIAENWVGFMFASMMFPAVAAAVLVLAGGIFDALAATAQKAGAQALPSVVYSIASMAIAFVAGMVMLQVPRITQALFGNGLGVESPHLPKPQQKKQN